MQKGASMSCNEGLRLQAYFDGELDANAALEIEQQLKSCGDCASLLVDLETTRQAIRRNSPYHRAGAVLREDVMEALVREDGLEAPRKGRFGLSKRFLSGAVSGAGVTALAAA